MTRGSFHASPTPVPSEPVMRTSRPAPSRENVRDGKQAGGDQAAAAVGFGGKKRQRGGPDAEHPQLHGQECGSNHRRAETYLLRRQHEGRERPEQETRHHRRDPRGGQPGRVAADRYGLVGRPQEFAEHRAVVVKEKAHPVRQEAGRPKQGHAHAPHGGQQGQRGHPAGAARMLADGSGRSGPVLEPLVAGVVERVLEPVPDHHRVGDAEPVAGLLQPDPQLHIFPGAEVVVEPDGEEHVAAHQCGADAEPAAYPAVVVVPGQCRTPVPGAVGFAGQPELQAVVAAGLEFGQQPAAGCPAEGRRRRRSGRRPRRWHFGRRASVRPAGRGPRRR